MKPPFLRSRLKSAVEPLEPRIAPATITVQNLNDSGVGSLRAAIAEANGTPAADTILFKAGLTGTVVLLTEIDITAPLSVKGPGGAKIVISGNNSSRIFDVNDGDDEKDSPLAVSGLVFTQGAGGNGTAINSTESLTVTSSIFSRNNATANGGAILVQGGKSTTKVTITSSQFHGNTADKGGGLYLEAGGGVSIVKSIFTGNSSTGNAGAAYISHDALLNASAKILIAGSTFVGNNSTGSGGALRIDGDNSATVVSIVNTRITGNTAVGVGGGLYLERGNLIVSGSVFSNNTAQSGGGIASRQLANGSVTKTLFANNHATGVGTSGGGGISLGIKTDGNILTVTASTFTGNTSQNDGGGISSQDGGVVKTVASIFTANRSVDRGGAISTNGLGGNSTALTVTGGVFTDNSADSGGAIDSDGDGAVSITAGKFRGNRTTANDGGALYLRTSTTIYVVSSLFSENFASDDGGGLILGGDGAATLSGLTFLNNFARDEGGGLASFDGTFSIAKSLFRSNHADTGGGISVNGGTGTIQTSVVTGNTASTSHGGAYRPAAINLVMAPTTKIVGNVAQTTPDFN